MKVNSKFWLGILIASISLFYWFQIRPTKIKKECLQKVREESVVRYDMSDYPDVEERSKLQNEYGERNYQTCLIERGL